MNEIIKHRCEEIKVYLFTLLKWLSLSVVVGVVLGFVGTAFHFSIEYATEFRAEHSWVLWTLPLGGVIIAWSYKICQMSNDKGTNLVIMAVRENERINFRTAPLIFASTVITHFCGGSAGREGAALQLGGSISSAFGRLLKLSERDEKIITMCGMAAAFSALFGTPIGAVVFAMEVVTVGVMYYSAILPCTVASVIGAGISASIGAKGTSYTLLDVPTVTVESCVKILLLGILCAIVSVVFCTATKTASRLYKRFIPNAMLRGATGGAIIIGLTLLVGSYDYNGAGTAVIERAISGEVNMSAFALKILFTALTLGAGFKGGEIVPTFFIGSTFGATCGRLMGISPSLCAGVGLSSMFCAVTNCPLTAIVLSMELFGFNGISFFAIGIAVAYMMSGYYGLYSEQKIMYSKLAPEVVDKKAN